LPIREQEEQRERGRLRGWQCRGAVQGRKRADPSSSESGDRGDEQAGVRQPVGGNARIDERTGSSRSWKKPMKNADDTPMSSQPAKRVRGAGSAKLRAGGEDAEQREEADEARSLCR
jgi:hypothetical protein